MFGTKVISYGIGVIETSMTKTIPNLAYTQCVEPFEDSIRINGINNDNINYMFKSTNPYYFGVKIFPENNLIIDIEGLIILLEEIYPQL